MENKVLHFLKIRSIGMKTVRTILIFPLLLLWSSAIFGQQPDSTKNNNVVDFQQDSIFQSLLEKTEELPDSIVVKPKKKGFAYRLFKEDYPNPNKSLFLSLAIPGGGQFYNRKWWKVPIVYAGYAALIYSASFNRRNYRALRDAVILEYQGEPHQFSNTNLSLSNMERLRDQYDKRKQLSYIGIFALHVVQAAEAFVDCHLKTFDVSDDLSIKVKPTFQPTPQSFGVTPGVGVSFTIK